MDMQSQMTRPHGHDQAEDPNRIHHPEEEENQEKGASQVLNKVKEKAKEIKSSLTKHGHEYEHEHVDEYDEQDPEVHGAPVYESSAVRDGVTGQTNVPAPEEIIPPGTKVFPVVSSDYTRPNEPEELRDTSHGHEAPSHPVRTKDSSDREERREAQSHPLRVSDLSEREERREARSHPLRVSDLSDREESREAHHVPLNTPASLLPATEDVTSTFAPGEDEHLGGQRKVNIETPIRLEEDPAAPGGGSDSLCGVSNYQSKVTDPTEQGGGEAGIPQIAESLGQRKVTDESHDQKSRLGFDRDLPARFGGESGAELGKDFPTRSHEFDQKNESGINQKSPTGFGGESESELGKELPTRSHELGLKNESGTTGLSSRSIAGLGEDFPARSHEYGQKTESGIGKNSPTGFSGGSGAGLGEDFPARSHEFSLKTESGFGKNSPTGSYGYDDEEAGPGLEKDLPARNNDVKVETALGRDLPTGFHDQFSPELSRPKERDDLGSKGEETRDKTQEPATDKAMAAKNDVASKQGYSGETGGGKHESTVIVDETPRSATGYGQKVAGTVAEKLTPVYEKVKETGSTVMTKLPFSGGGSGAEKTQQVEHKGAPARDYLAEKLRPGEEDKALSKVIAEKLHIGGGEKKTTKEVEVTVEKIPSDKISEEREHGETVAEEGKGAGGI